VAAPGRVELPTSCFVGRRSIQLSYGTGNISTIALYFCKDEATGFSKQAQSGSQKRFELGDQLIRDLFRKEMAGRKSFAAYLA
jgi:hypothetical protein